jgi:CheY-like chemotaxis protein
MLVDDNEADNVYHEYVLRKAGVANDIIALDSAEAAIAWLTNPDSPVVDLIYLDINMPRMSGFDFIEAYRKVASPARHIIIVMLTSSPAAEDVARADALAEISQYVTKPLTVETARDILDKYF